MAVISFSVRVFACSITTLIKLSGIPKSFAASYSTQHIRSEIHTARDWEKQTHQCFLMQSHSFILVDVCILIRDLRLLHIEPSEFCIALCFDLGLPSGFVSLFDRLLNLPAGIAAAS